MSKKLFVLNVVLLFTICFKAYSRQINSDSLLTALKNLKSDTAKVNALNLLSKELLDKATYDSALIFSNDAKQLSEKLNFQKGIADALTNTGLIQSKMKKYKAALANHTSALKIRTSEKDAAGIRYSYYNIGSCYQWLNLYKEASEYFFKSVKLAEASKDSFLLYKSFGSIAYLLQFLGNLNESIAYQKKAIQYAESQKDNFCLATIFLADYYALNNEPDKADSVLRIAYPIAVDLKSDYHLSYYYGIKSESEAQRNNYGNAILSLLNSNIIEERLPVSEKLAYNNANIANYILKCDNKQLAIAGIPSGKKFDESIRYARKSLDMTIPAGIIYMTSANYYHMSVAYKAKGNFEEALRYYEMHTAIKDSVFNAKNVATIQELNLKHQTKEKEQKIVLLENENKLKALREQNQKQKTNYALAGIAILMLVGAYVFNLYLKRKKLHAQLIKSHAELKEMQQQLILIEREKEAENIRLRISRDIHDDIGHSLTKISLLSDMTASDKQINSPEAIETLGRISDYSRNVNASLSEIVWAVSPKHDSLDSLIVYMRNHIHQFFENTGIRYRINFPDSYENRSINPELKRNIFLVLKESLNNILKYAKAKNVTVDFKIDGDQFELKIKDDGVGFTPLSFGSPDSYREGVRSGGNGLPNMKYRIEQTGGSFEINSSPNAGCEIFIKGILL